MKNRRRGGFTVIEVVIVLVLIILLIGLSLPSTGKGHRRATQEMGKNNLRQLSIGLHAHHDVWKRLPYNGTPDNWVKGFDPKSGSWAYRILPYIEQEPLFRAAGATKNVAVPTLVCPARERVGFTTEGKYAGTTTDYAINTWLNDRLNGSPSEVDKNARIHAIMDGSSNTYMVGQLALPETEHLAMDAGPGRETIFVGGTLGTGRNGGQFVDDRNAVSGSSNFGAPFPGRGFFAMGDASVRDVSFGMDLLPGLRPDDARPAVME